MNTECRGSSGFFFGRLGRLVSPKSEANEVMMKSHDEKYEGCRYECAFAARSLALWLLKPDKLGTNKLTGYQERIIVRSV
jgi:hypothetical protein